MLVNLLKFFKDLIAVLKRQRVWLLAGTTVATILTIWVQKGADHLWNIFITQKPTISYQITTVNRYSKITISNVGTEFNFDLDDSVIPEYTVITLRIANKGPTITSAFTLRGIIADGEAKIMDVRHTVKLPRNKLIAVTHSVPKFKLTIPKDPHTFSLIWNASTSEDVKGYHVYRSTIRDRGYGNINNHLITKTCVRLPVKESAGFYTVAAVSESNLVSELSKPVKMPESAIVSTVFDNAVVVAASLRDIAQCSQSNKRFKTLAEALKQESTEKLFLVMGSRPNMQSASDVPPELLAGKLILYDNDLDFLRGKVDLSFPYGLDENAELEVLTSNRQ